MRSLRDKVPNEAHVTDETLEQTLERKRTMRREAYDRRNTQGDKDKISEAAVARFMALPEYQASKVAMWYIDCRSETRTKPALLAEVAKGDKKIIVPYCTENENGDNKLGLWHMRSLEEMVVGKWNILEPPRELWGDSEREVEAEELDLILVPGVGFDRQGHRMGNGQGYYDRLLEKVRVDCSLVALCYESQLFDDIPVAPHDVLMDKVVTETAVYESEGRNA